MNCPRCALFTTIYPQVRSYLPAWYQSVLAQNDNGFDLWLGVDGLSKVDVAKCLGEEPRAEWVTGESGASIRLQAMKTMTEQYDVIIFVDSDDVMIPSRVFEARRALQHHEVVGCALRVINHEGAETGVVFAPESDWRAEKLLVHYNVFGLSNTAYRTSVLRRCLPFPKECVLIDWFLATRAWLSGADLWFDQTPQMLYRQHGQNTTRILPPFRPTDILDATKRVVDHYGLIIPLLREDNREHALALRAASQEVVAFDRVMRGSAERLDAYTRSINELPPRYVWWWAVANPQFRHLWNN